MRNFFKSLRSDKRGVTTIEYAILAALIGLGVSSSMNSFVQKLNSTFNTIGTAITNVHTTPTTPSKKNIRDE